jgi:peptidyl-prolyl cis-trans isomerase SurA
MKSFNNLLLNTFLFLMFALPGLTQAEPKVIDQIVATVNGHPILLSELEKQKTITAKELKAQGKEGAMDQPNTFTQKVLTQMIEDYLLDQEIERLGIQAGDAQLQQVLQSIMAENRITSKEEFRKALESQGYEFEEFVENYRKRISRNNYVRQTITPNITVSEQDIQNRLKQTSTGETIVYNLALLFVPQQNIQTGLSDKEFLDFAQKLKTNNDLTLAQKKFNVSEPVSMNEVDEKDLQKEVLAALKNIEVGEVSDPITLPNGFAWVKKKKEIRGQANVSEEEKQRISDLILNEEVAQSLNQAIATLKDTATIRIFYP